MQGEEKSAKTIANVHGRLSAALSTAVRLKLRPDTLCKGVILPKAGQVVEPVTLLTHEEFRLLMRFPHPHYVPQFRFLVATGLRMGEATALLASDFHLESATPSVRISKAWKQDGAGGYYVGRRRPAGRAAQ